MKKGVRQLRTSILFWVALLLSLLVWQRNGENAPAAIAMDSWSDVKGKWRSQQILNLVGWSQIQNSDFGTLPSEG